MRTLLTIAVIALSLATGGCWKTIHEANRSVPTPDLSPAPGTTPALVAGRPAAPATAPPVMPAG